MFHVQQLKSYIAGVSLLLVNPVFAGGWAEKYPLCEDYTSKGASLCAPQQAPAMPISLTLSAPLVPTLLPPSMPTVKDPVDAYLENYGKPPREFVEFYISPTTENARKWAAKYQETLEKSKSLLNKWEEVDGPVVSNKVSAVVQPAVLVPQTVQPMSENNGSLNLSTYNENNNILSYSDQIEVTYYFSANCPYCAQMTPDLAQLSAEMKGKLSLTCVDVTPISPEFAPKPENITGKLPCAWRLPTPNEVEKKSIQQTPTLSIKKGNKPEQRLSGYVPLADLKTYVAR